MTDTTQSNLTPADMATAAAQGFRDGQDSMQLPAAGQEPVALPIDGEIALIEKALERVGISSLLNHGAASCVFTEGCCGVSQDQILAYTREIALHCAVALDAAPQPAVAAGGQVMNQTTCGNCGGTGQMVRDPDIGTDQECFVCEGTGSYLEFYPGPVEAERDRCIQAIRTTLANWRCIPSAHLKEFAELVIAEIEKDKS